MTAADPRPIHHDETIEAMKVKESWHSPRLGRLITLARYGHFGTPVLLFPTAGGDAEECERFLMMKHALKRLLEAGRIKVYSVDSVAGAEWLAKDRSPVECAVIQDRFIDMVAHEVMPAIRADCRTPDITAVVAGASIGAFNALCTICRHPDLFHEAICMSGSYDLAHWMGDHGVTDAFHHASPLHWLPTHGESERVRRLRERMVVIATGEGRYEEPAESWKVAGVLGAAGVPNRVDLWGPDWHHDWVTWRAMLPYYLGDEQAPGPRDA